MTYREHLDMSRTMTLPQMDNALRTLGRDERFAAVVGWLDRNRESFVAAGSRQDICAEHGKLAHAQGSVHALNRLADQLTNLLGTPLEWRTTPTPTPRMNLTSPEMLLVAAAGVLAITHFIKPTWPVLGVAVLLLCVALIVGSK